LADARAMTRVRFAPTPRISSYLTVICVGELSHLEDGARESPSFARVRMRLYAVEQRARESGAYVLSAGRRALDFLETYFVVAFPLRKLDLVAVNDFSMLAMENWGLITGRESRMLIDPRRATYGEAAGAIRTLCHEISHMWYGNLVSLDFWCDLWLKEGFARY